MAQFCYEIIFRNWTFLSFVATGNKDRQLYNDMSAKTHQKIYPLVLPCDICTIDPLYFFRSILGVKIQGTK